MRKKQVCSELREHQVGWNDGSVHQKQHLNWRWDVGGASQWALQPVCADTPGLRVEERGPRVLEQGAPQGKDGGRRWSWQRLRSSSHRSQRKTRELLAGMPRGTCGQMPPEGQVR